MKGDNGRAARRALPAYTVRRSWARPLPPRQAPPPPARSVTTRNRNALEQKWPQTLWIVRHGQSAGNVARDAAELGGLAAIEIAHRDVDVPLSPLGEQQAEALGD